MAAGFSNGNIIVRRDSISGCVKQPNQNLTTSFLSPSGLLQIYFRKGFCFPFQVISLPQLINVSIDVLSSFSSPLRTLRLSAFKPMLKKRSEPPKEFTFLPGALTFKSYILE